MKKKIFSKKLILFSCILLSYCFNAQAQKQITGTILSSEDNKPIIGANINVKGNTKGVVSDLDGKFSLNNMSPQDVLVISYIGFINNEITVGNKSVINVILKTDSQSLKEIVVVGYGTTKKSDITGAISSVNSKDFNKQPLTDLSQALQGRAAGVQVNQSSEPGGNFKIRIRGANSVTGSNEPLYVVDGQFVDISTVNVNDVQSMEVLKDASSTAIYGTRGANGVILITTKKGRSGKAKINVDVFSGIANVAQKLDMMSASEFAEGVNFSEKKQVFTPEEIEKLRISGGEDWQDRLLKTATFNNVQISASGGSENIDYYLSGNYYETDGTLKDQTFKRLNFRSNLNAKLSDKIKVGLNLNIGTEEKTGFRANLSTGLAFDPTTPAYTATGDYNYNSLKNLATSYRNPLVDAENNIRENNIDRVSLNGNFNWDIVKNLTFNSTMGLTNSEVHNNGYNPSITSSNGAAFVDNIYTRNVFVTNRFTYTFNPDTNNNLKIDAIHELVKVNSNTTNINASDFFTDALSFKNLSAAKVYLVSNSESNKELESFLGRVNYSLFNKYLLTATFRADGSSVFQNNKWGYFPSASIAWKINEEKMFKNIESINNLKLRLSYGKIGNQGIETFGTMNRAVIDPNINYPFLGTLITGVAPSNRVANPDLTWEKTNQINAGIDIGLFNSALTMSIDYYKKNTTDLLLDTQLPSFVGPTKKYVNAGEVENQGFEITLGSRILKNDNWLINSTLTVSRNQNKVLSLNDGLKFIEIGNNFRGTTPTRVEVGLPISSFRGYIFEGVYQLGEEAEAAKFNRKPGDAKYKDVNGDGLKTTDDITNVGDGNPDFSWGWNWDINYKNWNLNFVVIGAQGNDIYNYQRSRLMGLGEQQFHAVYGEYRDRWTTTNPSNIPSGRDGTELLSTQFIEDGSYVTMKNIALGYNFDNYTLKKIGLNSFRLYASVQNLFTITKYKGFDPEATQLGNNADADVGIDLNSYPMIRTFTMGINVTF